MEIKDYVLGIFQDLYESIKILIEELNSKKKKN
jgi:hypothetical protein